MSDGIEQVLGQLRLNRNFMDGVVTWERIAARRTRLGEMPPLSSPIHQALTATGVQNLYLHQAEAIEAALDGANVVIATATASGKSLCYSLPVLEKLHIDPKARALYLFPTKALTQDQLSATRTLIDGGNLQVDANIYDGDTPRSQRTKIRRSGGILMTNPDMLHAGMLPYHTGWRDLFANLKYVVIDEIHTYRGVFGSHVANLLRRLKRICEFYGGRPQFICCSATIANPAEHAERLCNSPFTVIGDELNGAPQGEKSFVLYNPPFIDEELGIRQSILLSATDAASVFLDADVQTVVFARSRQAVELLLGYLRDADDFSRDPNAIQPELERIAGYRGGYLPHERRRIEMGLRSAEIRGVVATNALELGIDIGGLGAAVLTGYPGSIAGVWQQAGRAGRRDKLSAVIMVAGNSPLDQYICKHPRYLFGTSPENALINPDNLKITLAHLQCAAYELPFEPHEDWGGFEDVEALLNFMQDEGMLHETRQRYHFAGEGTPSSTISLRTSGTDNVVVQTTGADGAVVSLGEVALDRASVTVYEDAIYLHAGQSYFVDEFDYEGRMAMVRPIEVDYYTRASVSSEIRSLQDYNQIVEGDLIHAHGDVLIVTKATGYRKVRRYTHETLGMGRIDLPPMELDTTGYWLILGESLTEKLYDAGILQRPNDYGPNWQTQRQKVLTRDGNRCRSCGSETQLHVHHIRPFKEYGYIRGLNENYLQANRVDNLVTLCASCHRKAEVSVAARSAMGGLAYVLRNLAPLFLMCDSEDISVSAETKNPLTKAPTIVIYERAAAGVGFSEKLFDLRRKLLLAALELISDCNCRDGCPACVGPPGEIGPNTKAVTTKLLSILTKKPA